LVRDMKGKRRKSNARKTRADGTQRQIDLPKTSNAIPWYRARGEKPVKMVSKINKHGRCVSCGRLYDTERQHDAIHLGL